MQYKIIIKKNVKKFIDKLPNNEKKRIITEIEKLPHCNDIKKLKGHADLYRLRVGNYRIIYTINDDELLIYIVNAGNRGQIYNYYWKF